MTFDTRRKELEKAINSEATKIANATSSDAYISGKNIADLLPLHLIEIEREKQEQAILEKIILGERPVIFGVKSHYNWQTGGFTSEWNTQYSQEFGENLIRAVAGIEKDYGGVSIANNYMHFDKFPEIIPNIGNTHYGFCNEHYLRYAGTSNLYSYSSKPFILIPLYNSTDVDIDISITPRTTSYTTYSGFAINVFTPNETQENKTNITGYTWLNKYNYTSNSKNVSTTQTITIPAGKTVIIQVIGSDSYYTSTYTHYSFFRQMMLENIANMFPSGISVDTQVLKNMVERKITDFLDIWRYVPSV